MAGVSLSYLYSMQDNRIDITPYLYIAIMAIVFLISLA